MVAKVTAGNLPRRRDRHADGQAEGEPQEELGEELHVRDDEAETRSRRATRLNSVLFCSAAQSDYFRSP